MSSAQRTHGEFRYGTTHGGIWGEGNTIQSLPQSVNAPGVLDLVDNQTLVCKINPTVNGQFIMRPGDKFILSNPDWGRRFMWIDGECQWEDCTVEGAVWVDVGSGATGFWKNVTVRTGDAKGYPVIYFRTSNLQWDGGLVDCFPAQGTPAVTCVATRDGYYPGPFTNTIRNVTFRCHHNFLVDSPKQRHDVDLTFENCVIETRGDHTANIQSKVKVTDGCSSVITLKNCIRRHDGVDAPALSMIERKEVTLIASGCTVRFVEGDEVIEVRQEGLVKANRDEGNYLRTLTDTLAEVGRHLADLSTDERLRGTLCYARARLDDLKVVRQAIERAGRYSTSDVEWADSILAEIRDAVSKALLTLEAGSVYNPASAPLDIPPSGEATVEDMGDGKLRIRTYDSEWIYFRNPNGDAYAAFLPESHVRGKPVFQGAYPNQGGPGVRYVHPNATGTMLWEHPWTARIAKALGRIVAFEIELMTSETLGARATWVFFYDLPDVILCNCRSLQIVKGPRSYTTPTARLQAYARPELRTYNGMRLWNNDPEGVKMVYAPIREHIDVTEPEHGFFFGESPAWYYTSVSKGLVVAQWNGYNDWGHNPPCGYIVRASDYLAGWTGLTNYYSHIVMVTRQSQPRDADDLDNQVLWFEGAGLKCWDNLYNLEAAFSNPSQPVLDLTDGGPGRLLLWERKGLARNLEIVVLPRSYALLKSSLEWHFGDICVTLLRDVPAHSEVELGTLPVTCEKTGAGYVIRNGAETLRDLWVKLRADGAVGLKVNGADAENVVTGDNWVAFRGDLGPGQTEVELVLR